MSVNTGHAELHAATRAICDAKAALEQAIKRWDAAAEELGRAHGVKVGTDATLQLEWHGGKTCSDIDRTPHLRDDSREEGS